MEKETLDTKLAKLKDRRVYINMYFSLKTPDICETVILRGLEYKRELSRLTVSIDFIERAQEYIESGEIKEGIEFFEAEKFKSLNICNIDAKVIKREEQNEEPSTKEIEELQRIINEEDLEKSNYSILLFILRELRLCEQKQ